MIYDETIWSPLDLLSRFLDDGGSGPRAGVFFIATAFALAQLGTNIAANSVSAGEISCGLLYESKLVILFFSVMKQVRT